MKIGLRTVKTGVAVTISIFIALLFKDSNPFYAAIAAVIVMQPTVSDSWKIGINRMLGTLIGASLGAVFAFISPGHPILAGIGIIVLIALMNKLGWHDAIAIASVVFAGTFINSQGSYLFNAFQRVFDTFIGIGTAVVINYVFFPPIYDANVIKKIISISNIIWQYNINAVESILYEKKDSLQVLTMQIKQIEEELDESKKYLELQEKEEKVKLYGDYRCQDMNTNINLLNEIFQHQNNIYNILDKGISKDAVAIIRDDMVQVEHWLKHFTDNYSEEKKFKGSYYENYEKIIQSVKKTKKNLKNNEKINEFPTDEIVKMIVFLYNLEEILCKYNMLKYCKH